MDQTILLIEKGTNHNKFRSNDRPINAPLTTEDALLAHFHPNSLEFDLCSATSYNGNTSTHYCALRSSL